MCKDKSQNRINYIVLSKPAEAAKIVEKHGYEAPKKKEDLLRAVKTLVKRKGEPVIKDLIRIHPERELILAVTGHKSDESNYCGCSSSYDDTKNLLDQLSDLSVADLTRIYDEAKKKAKESPDDKLLGLEVETIWDELKRRKKQTEKTEQKAKESTEVMWMKVGLAVCVGFIIGKLM